MKSFLWCVAACLLASVTPLTAPAASAAGSGPAVIIPLHGEVSEAQFFFLRRALKEAETNNASVVVLDMDTYGGELQAAEEMSDALLKVSVPTVTYVDTNAGSAGAIIALSTKRIFMSPVSTIGAAAPVASGGQELPATISEKVVSYFSAYARGAAQKNGYNPEIAEAFINKDKEVKIGAELIHGKGSVLSLSAQEATRLYNEKPLLASGIADSLPDLLKKAGYPAPERTIEPTGFEHLAFWVTELAPLFLLIGIVGAYVEFKMHGTMIPGVISAIAFLLFFAGHNIAGLAGWETVVFFVIGLALVVGEVFLHPGTVIPGLVGLLLVMGSLFWAMIDRYPTDPLVPTSQMLALPMRNLTLAVLGAGVCIYILGKYLPESRLYKRLVLGATNSPGPSFSGPDAPSRIAPGAQGVARTILRPSGKAEFGDKLVDVITQGEFLSPDTKLHVLAVEGSRIVVEQRK